MLCKIVSSRAVVAMLIALSFSMRSCFADDSLKQQFVQKNGTVPKDGYVPKVGYVPDGKTAIAIALAVLAPIYGRDVLDSQMPFNATLVGGVWVVTGTLEHGAVGGVAEVNISKKTGTILRVIHGQ